MSIRRRKWRSINPAAAISLCDRVSGTDAYNPYITGTWEYRVVDSVETIITEARPRRL